MLTGQILFTAANWNTPQTIYLRAVDDSLAEGERDVEEGS